MPACTCSLYCFTTAGSSWSQGSSKVSCRTRMAPKLAALDENNDAVRAQLLKRAKPSRRPGLVVGDIVKIARSHTAGRRIKDAQFGGQAYPVRRSTTRAA